MSYKIILICSLLAFLLLGCADAQLDTKVNTDVDTNIKAEVESLVKMHLDSLIKAQLDTKVQGIGVDIKNKIADEIKADITADITAKVTSQISAQLSTQNTGMFSGGAIYVMGLGMFIVASIVFAFVWIVKSLFKYKNLWQIISASIEEHSHKEGSTIKDLKSSFGSLIQEKGLQKFVDKNLKNRGLNKAPKG